MTLPSDESETKSPRNKKKILRFPAKSDTTIICFKIASVNFIYEVKMPFDTLGLEAQLIKVGWVLYVFSRWDKLVCI